jgi:hypothetical protein
MKLSPVALVALGLLATAPASAHAEEWEVTLTPYLWGTGLKGDLGTLPGLPVVHVDAGVDGLLDNLQMAFSTFGEARRGRWGVLGDFSYTDLGLSKSATVDDPTVTSVGLGSKTTIAALFGAYRVAESDRLSVDVYGGARVTWADNDLRLIGANGAALDTDHKETWVDPVVGGRVIATLNPKWSLTGVGDIGGFGVSSDFAWQLMGAVNYRINDRFSFSVGYRHYGVDYQKDGFVYDAAQSGPIIGSLIRF